MGMIFIGVDPGLGGCLCVLDPDKNEVQFFDAPVLEMVVNKKNKGVLDAYRMVQILKDVSAGRQVMVSIEKVQAMPGGGERTMGATSAFNFGMGYGLWLGILAALELPYQTVHPATWKARMMSGCSKEKDASRAVAMQHYPRAAKELARKKDDGRADSALIARWGWLTYGGQPAAKPKEGLFD
jgi:crossover junction endodeoxyribonuclease RuvC